MKGKIIGLTTVAILATSITASAFSNSLSGTKSGNLISYRAQTTTNQNATHANVTLSYINSSNNNVFIASRNDNLGSFESGRPLNAVVSGNGYNASTAKGLFSEHYANENQDYKEDIHKGIYDTNGNLKLTY
ncbi:hypothetical protein ACQKJC_24990 [Priestia koreensis]|uniref:hypothetical protein n=1 Tax=Priestia koreensis TaxID=284581 RepID=UPI003CFF2610